MANQKQDRHQDRLAEYEDPHEAQAKVLSDYLNSEACACCAPNKAISEGDYCVPTVSITAKKNTTP